MVRALCAPYELRFPLVGAMPSHRVRRWRILLPQYIRRVSRPRREGTAAAPSARLLSCCHQPEKAARLNPVEIAVDVELQQHRWMVGSPSGCFRLDTTEAKFCKIEFVDKDVDRANRIVLINPIFQ